ncbi:NAD(P)-binding protein [Mycena sanguinolenta]|uniref:NAD(P)-binding protein n=1 Tax=Mycena sanguinolenta TaxID=230812 RepID=A0A8H6YNZ0_9AGAR|nr:NAD(P)-binding protein [Mycena sanguinolenta]
MSNTVLITGAAGFLGSLLSETLATFNVRLILADIVEPKSPKSSDAVTVKVDLTARESIDNLFKTQFGVPDTIYCLHGIMSRGAEENFDFGLQVNFDSIRLMLQAARDFGTQSATLIKFIFASSLAVYGGPLPHTVTSDTIATPEGAYGLGKLASELFVNEFSRRGFVDGRILRLPTIAVRHGAPAAATSAFISGIIREPLKGIESLCPIGDSLDSPRARARALARQFPLHSRVVCLPGFTATVRDELDALEKVGGKPALDLVRFKDDPVSRRLVSSWPSRFDNTYALSLGFVVDEGGMEPIVRRFREDIEAGRA